MLHLLEDREGYDLIPGLILMTIGVATHVGITCICEFLLNKIITHDLSFPEVVSKESVTSRITRENLEPIMFGFVLFGIIHYIVNLCRRLTFKIILIRKEDFKSTYRRSHKIKNVLLHQLLE